MVDGCPCLGGEVGDLEGFMVWHVDSFRMPVCVSVKGMDAFISYGGCVLEDVVMSGCIPC